MKRRISEPVLGIYRHGVRLDELNDGRQVVGSHSRMDRRVTIDGFGIVIHGSDYLVSPRKDGESILSPIKVLPMYRCPMANRMSWDNGTVRKCNRPCPRPRGIWRGPPWSIHNLEGNIRGP